MIAAPEAQISPSEKKVRVGFIGVGDRGTGLLKVALQYPQLEVPVVCDIDPNLTNVFIGEDWTIWRIDFSRAFLPSKDLREPSY